MESGIQELLNGKLNVIEEHFDADCLFFYGPIGMPIEKLFRDALERFKSEKSTKTRLVIIICTGGGSVETVEKMVNMTRFHYSEVYFVVPDYSMSAGTIFAMSGNEIYMDYSSALGPIDPQVHNGKDWVPALGYLDKVDEFVKKSAANSLSSAEFVLLQAQDIAMLSRFEQAKELSITLLKKWLVIYKFSKWVTHLTNSEKLGLTVSLEEKQERAERIATQLSNNRLWHSHSRFINIDQLNETCRLKINDYSQDDEFRSMIREYNDIIMGFVNRTGTQNFIHTRYVF
jgi:Serine dehydrogenase proteinase